MCARASSSDTDHVRDRVSTPEEVLTMQELQQRLEEMDVRLQTEIGRSLSHLRQLRLTCETQRLEILRLNQKMRHVEAQLVWSPSWVPSRAPNVRPKSPATLKAQADWKAAFQQEHFLRSVHSVHWHAALAAEQATPPLLPKQTSAAAWQAAQGWPAPPPERTAPEQTPPERKAEAPPYLRPASWLQTHAAPTPFSRAAPPPPPERTTPEQPLPERTAKAPHARKAPAGGN